MKTLRYVSVQPSLLKKKYFVSTINICTHIFKLYNNIYFQAVYHRYTDQLFLFFLFFSGFQIVYFCFLFDSPPAIFSRGLFIPDPDGLESASWFASFFWSSSFVTSSSIFSTFQYRTMFPLL